MTKRMILVSVSILEERIITLKEMPNCIFWRMEVGAHRRKDNAKKVFTYADMEQLDCLALIKSGVCLEICTRKSKEEFEQRPS